MKLWELIDIKNDDECWEWRGPLTTGGYGRYRNSEAPHLPRRAHRAVYQLLHPEEDISRMSICHKCDNPKCCNPSHLFSGTHTENMADMRIKGRVKHKLSPSDISFILESRELTNRELAERLGVDHSTVSGIRRKNNQPDRRTIITVDQAREIKYATGSLKSIANRFGVSISLVSNIQKGRNRKYV